VSNEERLATIDALLLNCSQAMARKAALVSEAKEFEANIGEIRASFGNPYFYSGVKAERPETANASAANYTGYRAHDPGLRLVRRVIDANREVSALIEQLCALGVTVY
jgi:hypothetical protein